MKAHRHKVVALGIEFHDVERNVTRLREQGWTLVSTYVDVNRALRREFHEPTVVGVFETWEKVRR